MTWFSDKLGKKFIFKALPSGISRGVSDYDYKPVQAIGFHGEPDRHLTYYTVKTADGHMFKAYEPELTEEVNVPISNDEQLIAYRLLVDQLKTYLKEVKTAITDVLPDTADNRAYVTCLDDTARMIDKLESSITQGIK